MVKKKHMKLTTIFGLGILMLVASACEKHPASELPKKEKHGEAGHGAAGHEGSGKAEVKSVAEEK